MRRLFSSFAVKVQVSDEQWANTRSNEVNKTHN
jgi:hypothetical protein